MPPKIVFASSQPCRPSWQDLAGQAPKEPPAPTAPRLAVLRYVDAFQRAYGYAPTYRQIASGLGQGRAYSAVYSLMRSMVRDGQLAPRDNEREPWHILVELPQPPEPQENARP